MISLHGSYPISDAKLQNDCSGIFSGDHQLDLLNPRWSYLTAPKHEGDHRVANWNILTFCWQKMNNQHGEMFHEYFDRISLNNAGMHIIPSIGIKQSSSISPLSNLRKRYTKIIKFHKPFIQQDKLSGLWMDFLPKTPAVAPHNAISVSGTLDKCLLRDKKL